MISDPRARQPTRWGRRPPFAIRLAAAWLTNAILLGIIAALLAHVTVHSAGALIAAAAVFGVLNTIVKPILRFITLPLAILSLGLAWFFVSMLMLVITRALVPGFHVRGFWTLVAATLIIWVVNLVLDMTPGPWQITSRRLRRSRRNW